MTPDDTDAGADAGTIGFGSDRMAQRLQDELHALAAGFLRYERRDHTLQPTALVNEAWIRMFGGSARQPDSRAGFLAMAATTMRRLLVDHARKRAAQRRDGGVRLTMTDPEAPTGAGALDVLAVDEALRRLAELDERQARMVELRFFGGLNDDEIADVLAVSRRTVQGDWTMARAWLRRELAAEDRADEQA